MPSSKTQICNMALMNIGEDRVTDVDTATQKRAAICREFYDQIRDMVLVAYPWSFAGKRETLAQLTTTPLSDYVYEYQMPSDYLKNRKRGKIDDDIKYLIEGNKLLTDEESVILNYTFRETDAAKYSPGMVQCFVYRLAAAIVMPIVRKKSVAEAMMDLYRDVEIESYELESGDHNDEEVNESDDLINV